MLWVVGEKYPSKRRKREKGGEKRKIAFTHTHTESTHKRHKIEGRELFTRRRRAKYHKNRPTDLRQLKEIEPLTFTSLSFYYEKHLLCNFLASKSTHINFYRRAREKKVLRTFYAYWNCRGICVYAEL